MAHLIHLQVAFAKNALTTLINHKIELSKNGLFVNKSFSCDLSDQIIYNQTLKFNPYLLAPSEVCDMA